MRLKDRTALITGAASGIGKAIALRFAEEGARIVIADQTDEPREGGAKTLDEIEAMGGEAVFTKMNVADWSSVDAAVSLAVEKYGALDIIVNNAAIGVSKPILETTEEDWERVMGVNARGVFFGCKRAIQQMLTQPERRSWPTPMHARPGHGLAYPAMSPMRFCFSPAMRPPTLQAKI